MKELDVKKFLGRFSDANVDFFNVTGNYGDSLIWHGAKQLFKDLNIHANEITIDSAVTSDVLIINGSGNFIDLYDQVRNMVLKNHRLYKEVIILPSTIYGKFQQEILSGLQDNVTIFCREKITYKFVKLHAINCQVYMWHDIAFHNELELMPDGAGELNAFREDDEKFMLKKPPNNIDISKMGIQSTPIANFINMLSSHRVINTDRLHVCIGSAMLGKEVNFYPNSYYKNKAIYEYSIKNRYPKVKLITPGFFQVDNYLFKGISKYKRSIAFRLGVRN